MMHLWLNIGKQKARITKRAADAACPCCGHGLEDQIHLYTCSHVKMIAAVAEGISKTEKTLAKENVPPGVTITFVERVRKVTGTLTNKRRLQCNAAKKAGDMQDKLGPEAILRGHHHTPHSVGESHISGLPQAGVPPWHRPKAQTKGQDRS